jgi:hypothetical protein
MGTFLLFSLCIMKKPEFLWPQKYLLRKARMPADGV